MSVELTEVTQAVAEFDRVAAGIAALRDKYEGVVYDVTTTAGMQSAKEARREIREPRLEVERIRKAAKAPILTLGKKLDSEAARITKELLAIEEPLDLQVKTEEARKEAERQAKIDAELKRVSDLQERVAELRGCPNLSPTSGSVLIADHIQNLEEIVVDDSFQEFRQQAEDAKAAGLKRLGDLHAAALAHEAEQARIQAERDELARLRAEQARREAEDRARLAEEERQAKVAREAEAARQAAQLRRQREEEAAESAKRQAIIDTENARIRAEQEAASKRIQEEEDAQREGALLNQMRISEIQGIQQQVMIASLGRSGVRRGGTRECIVDTLEETRRWPITEEHFGPIFFGSARQAKRAAIAQIEQALLQRDIDYAQKERIAAERAELERQKAALSSAATNTAPSAEEIVAVLAAHYNSLPDTVIEWLCEMDFSDVNVESIAA
jgi:colicin import membrane protein